MEDACRKILDACTSGDIPTLTTLFQELEIGPNHPETPYSLDGNVPEEQQLPVVEKMFLTAITSRQPHVISFLAARFPKYSLCGYPMRAAINTGNAEIVEAVCKCDPRSANTDIGDDGCINALGHAASNENAAQLIKVLLDAGADPNADPPLKMSHNRNVSAAVIGNLPASTFEQFFDAGYRGNDPFAIEYAVSHQRPDVLQILVTRAKDFPDAQFPPEEELIEVATKADDPDMVVAIKSAYAIRSKQKKSLVASLLSKFRSRS